MQSDGAAPASGTEWSEEKLTAACARNFDVETARYKRCKGFDPNPAETRELSVASCKARLKLPGIGFTPESFEACSRANETAPCGDALEACAVTGRSANGAACRTSEECQSGLCESVKQQTDDGGVDPLLYAACGKCAKRGLEGDSCSEFNFPSCGTDLSCVEGKCVKSLALGSPCSPAEGPRCAGDSVRCIEGTCQKLQLVPLGGTCRVNAECGFSVKCSPDKKCVAPTWKEPGALCDGVHDLCKYGYFCSAVISSGGVVEKRCPATVLAIGDTCDIRDYTNVCPNYASCFEGKCESYYEPACK